MLELIQFRRNSQSHAGGIQLDMTYGFPVPVRTKIAAVYTVIGTDLTVSCSAVLHLHVPCHVRTHRSVNLFRSGVHCAFTV